MKKVVLALVVSLVVSNTSFASGKLIAQGVHSFSTDKQFLNLTGLSIYEKLFSSKHLFFEGFYGRIYNEYSEEDARETYTAKNMLGLRLGNLEMSGGHQYVNAVSKGIEHRALVKVGLKIW